MRIRFYSGGFNTLLIYTPYGTTVDLTRTGREKQKAIFKNKMKILEIAIKQNDEYFIMRDLDIIYSWGIEEMEAFLNENKDYGAVALWPHKGKIEHTNHISSSFMMIRMKAVDLFDYVKGCFCNHLCRNMRARGWKVRYLEGKIIHS